MSPGSLQCSNAIIGEWLKEKPFDKSTQESLKLPRRDLIQLTSCSGFQEQAIIESCGIFGIQDHRNDDPCTNFFSRENSLTIRPVQFLIEASFPP